MPVTGAGRPGAIHVGARRAGKRGDRELTPQGTLVTGLFVGAVDTDMMAGYDVPKNDPAATA